ncbi:hypothetical protein C7212DRAFT_343002 [Tuber magnatum]|uniref:Uncharacterized protein n=1 Tax=Tuber magnatum TaxID=42249 RepID=A0A317SUW3_9PEZI|nr:hypothetical protein C7212DRAFT_343002 [Tuber magnatum]
MTALPIMLTMLVLLYYFHITNSSYDIIGTSRPLVQQFTHAITNYVTEWTSSSISAAFLRGTSLTSVTSTMVKHNKIVLRRENGRREVADTLYTQFNQELRCPKCPFLSATSRAFKQDSGGPMDSDGQGYRCFNCPSWATCGKTIGVTQFLDLCHDELVQSTAVELLSTIFTSGSDLDMQDSHMIEGEIEERQCLELQVIPLEKTVLNLLPQNALPAFYDSSPYQQNTSMDKAKLMGYDISENEICLSDRSTDTGRHESELDNSHILQRSAVLLQASPPVPARAQEITIPTYSSVMTSPNIGNPDISHVPIWKKRSKHNSQCFTTTTALYISGMTCLPLKVIKDIFGTAPINIQLRFIHNVSWIGQ